ncbi:MAG: hypothetical protein IJ806_00595 [Ruminococcus sp.]|nr:hypothetical protein [Ruminococcus sp.]
MKRNGLEGKLSEDRKSREFFGTLSPTLRSRLKKTDKANFELLEKAAGGPPVPEADQGPVTSSASMQECTGLIPQGSGLSEEKLSTFGELFPFCPDKDN